MEKNIDYLKNLINDYCLSEFNCTEDFSDMENIGVAYTTLTDNEVPIQVSLDLIHMKLKTWIGNNIEPVKIEDITVEDIESLDFDSLISGWQFWIEDNYEKIENWRKIDYGKIFS